MKAITAVIIGIVLASVLVSAHALEKTVVVRSSDEYNVQFSTKPEYPVTGKTTHLDFEVWDNEGKDLAGLDFVVRFQKNNKVFTRKAVEHSPAHYSATLELERGIYTITPVINDKITRITFELFVDSFGTQGVLMVGTLALFAAILVILAYKDCRKKKKRKKK